MPKTPRSTAGGSVVGELPLDRLALRRGEEARRIEAGGVDGARQNLRVVELEAVLPHAAQAHFEIGGLRTRPRARR